MKKKTRTDTTAKKKKKKKKTMIARQENYATMQSQQDSVIGHYLEKLKTDCTHT